MYDNCNIKFKYIMRHTKYLFFIFFFSFLVSCNNSDTIPIVHLDSYLKLYTQDSEMVMNAVQSSQFEDITFHFFELIKCFGASQLPPTANTKSESK